MDDIALKKYSRSFMSNSKWRKLFSIVNESNVSFTHCHWKLITESSSKKGHLPDFNSLGNDHVGDCGALNGPFLFKSIEWVSVPMKFSYKPYKGAPTSHKLQSIEHLVEQLDAIGKFEYEKSSEGLKIYGYKP